MQVIKHGRVPKTVLFAERFACPDCGYSLAELEPRQFSFNSPYGACQDCGGLGTQRVVSEALILGDPRISILEGVVLPWGEPRGYLRNSVLPTLAKVLEFDLSASWGKLPARVKMALLHGVPDKVLKFRYKSEKFKRKSRGFRKNRKYWIYEKNDSFDK